MTSRDMALKQVQCVRDWAHTSAIYLGCTLYTSRIPYGGLSGIKQFINPRRACAARVTVVGCVCVSVKSHLTYGASVRPENAVTY